MIGEGLAELLGFLCAEGCYVNTISVYWQNGGNKRVLKKKLSRRIEVYSKDIRLLENVKNILKKEYSYEVGITKDQKINICKRCVVEQLISYTSFGHLSWKVPQEVMSGNTKIKISFLRGFFDGDGTSSGPIRMFSTNRFGLVQIKQLLDELQYISTLQKPVLKAGRKPLYTLQISRSQKQTFLSGIKPISKLPGMRGLMKC